MKKIHVSTVNMNSDVQVLFINASLIAKAINANNAIQDILEKAKACGCIVPRYENVCDDEGEVVDHKPVLDDKGNQVIDYTSCHLESYEVVKVNTVVATFLKELVDAFEA